MLLVVEPIHSSLSSRLSMGANIFLFILGINYSYSFMHAHREPGACGNTAKLKKRGNHTIGDQSEGTSTIVPYFF